MVEGIRKKYKMFEQWVRECDYDFVSFADELRQLLPAGLPFREECIDGAARHLELIVETNQHFNLTRIVNPREAAIKHVVDSVLPWRLFQDAEHVADAGSGAGFPGIPLALVLPRVRFTLLESTQKKARFLESVVRELRAGARGGAGRTRRGLAEDASRGDGDGARRGTFESRGGAVRTRTARRRPGAFL